MSMCHTRVTYLDTEGVNDVETVNVIGGGGEAGPNDT